MAIKITMDESLHPSETIIIIKNPCYDLNHSLLVQWVSEKLIDWKRQ